jgi:aryl-alcohol dehydrogenase-like predicted oxidoreductase
MIRQWLALWPVSFTDRQRPVFGGSLAERFISLSECSAESLKRGRAIHPLVSLQMEYSLISRDAEEQGQIDACKELGMAMMAYAVLGRGMLSDQVPRVEELTADDVRQTLPRFQRVNLDKNLGLRSALEAIARSKNATLAQLAIAWPMPGKACGSLHRPDPRREIAQAP